MSRPWADPDHDSYHRSRKRGKHKCLGCHKPCTYSAWGPWCYTCNVARMTRLDKSMAQLARSIGDKKTAREIED